MGTKTLSGQVRSGGNWVLRWTVRLVALLGLGVCLALPYAREVVGECRLVPLSQRGVRAPVAGEILTIEVREGDPVEPGTLIATLDDREYTAELATASAELDRLHAELDLLESGPRAEEVAMAREQLALWQVRLDHYERELVRLVDVSAGSVPLYPPISATAEPTLVRQLCEAVRDVKCHGAMITVNPDSDEHLGILADTLADVGG